VQKYWQGLMELIEKGEIDPLHMVSHRLKLEDIDKVYEMFNARKGVQKVFLETRHSKPPAPESPALTTL
jgi:threonine dehydrogenase-like Zn-dependent dehydrogenase